MATSATKGLGTTMMTERMFLDGILVGDDKVLTVTADAKKIASVNLRAIAREVGIPAAMCGDASDPASVVFAAKCFGGKRWEAFQQLVTTTATQQPSN